MTVRRQVGSAGIDRLDAQGRKLDIHALRHTTDQKIKANGARRGTRYYSA